MKIKAAIYPSVLIGIPVFNGGKTILRTINSLLKQNYPNYKILICDNCSTDDTKEIVLNLMNNNPGKIDYICNTVLSSGEENWNFLLNNIPTGYKYMALYHADDVYDSEIIKKQVAILEEHPVGATFTMCRMIDENDKLIKIKKNNLLPSIHPSTFYKIYEYTELLESIMQYHNFVRTPSFLFNIEALKSFDLSFKREFSSSADLDMWLRIAKDKKIIIINEHLFSYRLSTNQGSYLLTKGREIPADFFKVMDHHVRQLPVKPQNMTWLEAQRCLDLIFCALNSLRKNNVNTASKTLYSAIQFKYFFKTLRFSYTHFVFGLLLKSAFKFGIEKQFVKFIDDLRN